MQQHQGDRTWIVVCAEAASQGCGMACAPAGTSQHPGCVRGCGDLLEGPSWPNTCLQTTAGQAAGLATS